MKDWMRSRERSSLSDARPSTGDGKHTQQSLVPAMLSDDECFRTVSCLRFEGLALQIKLRVRVSDLHGMRFGRTAEAGARVEVGKKLLAAAQKLSVAAKAAQEKVSHTMAMLRVVGPLCQNC